MKSLKKIFMIVTIVFFTLCFFSSCDLFNLSYSGSIKFQLANNLDTLKPQAQAGQIPASEQKPFITVIIRGVDYSSYSYKLYDDFSSLNNDTLVISGIPRNSKVDVEVWLFNATYQEESEYYMLEDNKFGTKENVIVTSTQTYVNVKLLEPNFEYYTGSYYGPNSFNVVSQVKERVADHTDLKSEKLYTFLGKVELD